MGEFVLAVNVATMVFLMALAAGIVIKGSGGWFAVFFWSIANMQAWFAVQGLKELLTR